jgi:hypothetical protein
MPVNYCRLEKFIFGPPQPPRFLPEHDIPFKFAFIADSTERFHRAPIIIHEWDICKTKAFEQRERK